MILEQNYEFQLKEGQKRRSHPHHLHVALDEIERSDRHESEIAAEDASSCTGSAELGEYISVFLLAGSLGDVIMKLFYTVSGLEDGAGVDATRSFSRATALLEEE